VLQYGYHNDKEKKVGLYFAKDGNYGDATDLVLIDASNWENLDFRILDEASDDDRSRSFDWSLNSAPRSARVALLHHGQHSGGQFGPGREAEPKEVGREG
jgi:hypothetical protein